MAKIVVNNGLQIIGKRGSGVDASAALQTMAWDNRNVAFAAGDNSLGSPTNMQANAFDSAPTIAAQTVTHLGTLTSGQLNGIHIYRVSLHNTAAASTNGTSTGLCAGIDALDTLKTDDFALQDTVKIAYSNV